MTALGKSRRSLLTVSFSTIHPDSQAATSPQAVHPLAMLTEIYICALLVDEELADEVWEAWDMGEIDEKLAELAWMILASRRRYTQF